MKINLKPKKKKGSPRGLRKLIRRTDVIIYMKMIRTGKVGIILVGISESKSHLRGTQ